MNVLRFASLLSAGAITTAWFVTLAVRATVGAPDAGAQIAIGAVPTAPPSLRPLAIPARDPFFADASFAPGATQSATVRGTSGAAPGAGGGQFATTNVPDVAALGGAAANVGIMATIVSDSDAYALVEEGGSVRVAHVGDALGGSAIMKITDTMVLLANGVRISLDAGRAGSGSQSPGFSVAAASPSPLPSAAPVSARGEARSPSDGGLPRGASVDPSGRMGRGAAVPPATSPSRDSTMGVSGFGRTVLTNPNGTPVQPSATSGTLFPSVVASPTVIPLGGNPIATPLPGGHP